jgi:hypothetical protein
MPYNRSILTLGEGKFESGYSEILGSESAALSEKCGVRHACQFELEVKILSQNLIVVQTTGRNNSQESNFSSDFRSFDLGTTDHISPLSKWNGTIWHGVTFVHMAAP